MSERPIHLQTRDGLLCAIASARPSTTTDSGVVTCQRCLRKLALARYDSNEAWMRAELRRAAHATGLGPVYDFAESRITDGASPTDRLILDMLGSIGKWLEDSGYTLDEKARSNTG